MGKYIFVSQDEQLVTDMDTINESIQGQEGVRKNAGGGTAADHAIKYLARQIRRDQHIDRDDLTQALMRWRDLAYPIGRQVKQNNLYISDEALAAFDTIGDWLQALDSDQLPEAQRFPIPSLKAKAGYNRTLIAVTAIVLYANDIRRERAA